MPTKRQLEKYIIHLEENVENLQSIVEEHIRQYNDFVKALNHNGVATAINKLNAEVFNHVKEDNSLEGQLLADIQGDEAPMEPTLAGKIDGIIGHLGLEFVTKRIPASEAKVSVTTQKIKKGKK